MRSSQKTLAPPISFNFANLTFAFSVEISRSKNRSNSFNQLIKTHGFDLYDHQNEVSQRLPWFTKIMFQQRVVTRTWTAEFVDWQMCSGRIILHKLWSRHSFSFFVVSIGLGDVRRVLDQILVFFFINIKEVGLMVSFFGGGQVKLETQKQGFKATRWVSDDPIGPSDGSQTQQ